MLYVLFVFLLFLIIILGAVIVFGPLPQKKHGKQQKQSKPNKQEDGQEQSKPNNQVDEQTETSNEQKQTDEQTETSYQQNGQKQTETSNQQKEQKEPLQIYDEHTKQQFNDFLKIVQTMFKRSKPESEFVEKLGIFPADRMQTLISCMVKHVGESDSYKMSRVHSIFHKYIPHMPDYKSQETITKIDNKYWSIYQSIDKIFSVRAPSRDTYYNFFHCVNRTICSHIVSFETTLFRWKTHEKMPGGLKFTRSEKITKNASDQFEKNKVFTGISGDRYCLTDTIKTISQSSNNGYQFDQKSKQVQKITTGRSKKIIIEASVDIEYRNPPQWGIYEICDKLYEAKMINNVPRIYGYETEMRDGPTPTHRIAKEKMSFTFLNFLNDVCLNRNSDNTDTERDMEILLRYALVQLELAMQNVHTLQLSLDITHASQVGIVYYADADDTEKYHVFKEIKNKNDSIHHIHSLRDIGFHVIFDTPGKRAFTYQAIQNTESGKELWKAYKEYETFNLKKDILEFIWNDKRWPKNSKENLFREIFKTPIDPQFQKVSEFGRAIVSAERLTNPFVFLNAFKNKLSNTYRGGEQLYTHTTVHQGDEDRFDFPVARDRAKFLFIGDYTPQTNVDSYFDVNAWQEFCST